MMSMDQTFHQRWDFRRKDDEVDSLSDDSKSSSGDEPVGKKHKLLLSSPENDGANDTQISQQKSQVNPHFQIAKDKKQIKPGKKRNATEKKSKGNSEEKGKRKRKVNHPTLDQDPALLGDLKIFTASLLEELKVARKKMFVQMKKQMTKMVTAKPVLNPKKRSSRAPKSDKAMHQPGKKSGRKTQTCREGLTKGEKRSNGQRRSSGKLKVTVDKGEARSSSAKKPFPTVLPKPPTESLSGDSSLCDHIQGGISGTNANSAEREDSLADANNHCRYLLGSQPGEQFGSHDQITPKRTRFLNQQSSQTSSMLSALPAPLQQCSSNSGFNLTSQSVVESPADQENNSTGVRMNDGAMGFAGRSHAPPDCFVAKSISSNRSYCSNGGRGCVI